MVIWEDFVFWGEAGDCNGILARPVVRADASIGPYKLFAMFVAISKVSLRRDEGIPPYRLLYGLVVHNKSSVGNGLDRSETLLWMP